MGGVRVGTRVASPLRQYLTVFRSLSRDAKLLLAAGALESIPFGVLGVALPLYLKFLGYSEIVIGSVFSVLGGTAVILIVPFGLLADRIGRRPLLLVGGVLMGLSFLLMPFAENLTMLYIAAIVGGLSEALFFSTLQALLADATTPENRTAVFGISFFLGAAATAAGALASSVPEILQGRGWAIVPAYAVLFVTAGAVLLLTPVILFRVRVTGQTKAKDASLFPRRSASLISRFFVSNIIIGLGAGLVVPIFSLWFFLKYDQRESFTGPLFALGAAINAFASLVAPFLAKRQGLVRTGVLLQGSATLLLFLMAVTYSLPAAAMLYLGRNMLMNMTWPVMASFLMGAVHPEERSSASAVVGLSFRLPFAVSTTFGAAMMASAVDLPLLVTAGLYAVGTAAFWVFFRTVPAPGPAVPAAAH